MNGPYRDEAANADQLLSWEDKLKAMSGILEKRTLEPGQWQCRVHIMQRGECEAVLYGYGSSPTAAVELCHAQFTSMLREGWRRS